MNQGDKNYDDVDLSGMLRSHQSSVEFEELRPFNQYQRYGDKNTADSKMIRLVIKHSGGLIKSERQAQMVLLGFALLAIVISIILFSSVGNDMKIIMPPERK